MDERTEDREGMKGRKLLFWNVAGLERQDKEFWRFIKDFDFVSLCETWVNENSWDRIKGSLPGLTHLTL